MAIKQTGGTKLTGLNPLSYVGVEPSSPPQLVRFNRAPTNRDFGFNIGDLWLVEEPNEVWMLLRKPQNVAFWALIYPQAGSGGISLIHTDAGDVVPDVNGEIGIQGGENINVGVSGPNIVIVNLNRTIQWPTTNTSGTEGVIYLGGDRFLHNFGDGGVNDFNTFLGIDSGNFTLGVNALSNTGIGAITLRDITDGRRNTALGSQALSDITIGDNNIGIGYNSGTNVITGSDNIHIGNPGASADADSDVIRIGVEGTQTQAFMAGISGVNTTTTNNTFVMNVGTDGQLGETHLISSDASVTILQTTDGSGNNAIDFTTSGGGAGGNPFAFSYVQVGDSASFAPHTDYNMGSAVALTKLFDVGNNFFPGDGVGSAAFFTAPVTGKYFFEFLFFAATSITNQSVINFTTQINTSLRMYNQRALGDVASVKDYTLVTDMNMGDTAEFKALNIGNSPQNYYVSGNGGALGASNINSTRISGFLIPEGASGGNFSQPFLGIQQVNTGNVLGTPISQYLLGSSAPIVEIYDIGNNFDPGDGLGTPASFTAPATGVYSFTICFGIMTPTTAEMGIGLFTPSLNYFHNCGKFSVTGGFEIAQRNFDCSLVLGDTVTFPVAAGNSLSVSNDIPVIAGFGGQSQINIASTNVTFISGYRIA